MLRKRRLAPAAAFYLPTDGSGNRTVYVGLNRVVSPVTGPNGSRNGCGARYAIMFVQ